MSTATIQIIARVAGLPLVGVGKARSTYAGVLALTVTGAALAVSTQTHAVRRAHEVGCGTVRGFFRIALFAKKGRRRTDAVDACFRTLDVGPT